MMNHHSRQHDRRDRKFWVKSDDKGRFFDYVSDCGRPLVRTAYLLTDEWDEAEALLERGLARTFLRWRSAEFNDPTGHTLTGVAQAYFRRARGRSRGPAAPDADASETWRAVQTLPAEQRVAVVLRIFNGMSTAQLGDVMRTSEDQAERVLIAAADRLRIALERRPAADRRSLEKVLADEMAARVATLPPAPSRSVLAEQRANRVLRLRFAAAALAVAVAVPLLLSAWAALSGDRDKDPAPVAGLSTGSGAAGASSSAESSPEPTATRPTAAPSPIASTASRPATARSPAPKDELAVPLLVGRRLVDLSDGTARTVATLEASDATTVLRAGSSYVARSGPVRQPAALVRVSADGDISQIASSTGSVSVNGAGDRVAFTEVDADGTTVRVVLADLAGREQKAIASQFDSTAVRGFVGDAVLLSHRKGGAEVARRWNPVANDFTTLGNKYGAVLSVHQSGKLAVLQEVGGDCTVVAFIEVGVVHPRGRLCDRDISRAVVSPDRRQLAVAGDGEIVVLDVDGGLPVKATIPVEGVVLDLAWAGDGVLAVVTAPDDGADATVHECDVQAETCAAVWAPGTPTVRLAG
jgi:DNA-directed RNA polymerase specialized sigma24 family protein